MKYTKQLLSRYISGSYDLEKLARQLTLQSCEVEEVYERKIPELVVIGKVLSCEKHPDADKLTICQVDCWHLGTFQICTGATNIVEHIYVPAALPGCFLPAIHLQIDPRTMRGVASNGMICSKEELWIAEDMGLHGIWILQHLTPWAQQVTDFVDITDKDLGKPLSEHAPWLENRVLDVENKTITHRPDMFGHFWLAREINAIFPNNIRFSRLKSIADQITPNILLHTLSQAKSSAQQIQIDSSFVGTYSVIEIDGITIKESSLRQRLQLLDLWLGARNNRVDFSNYFMYVSGQPIHCFDADQIHGTLIVRQAQEWESFVDLFDAEHILTEQDIVICDEKWILALAGIIGGKRSWISDATTRILIEIAQFDPVVVRKTAMRLGIRTDAQTRFEKHIAPSFSLASILLCLDELEYLWKQELGNRAIIGTQWWIAPQYEKALLRTVPFEPELINRTLWVDLTSEEMLSLLTKLWLTLSSDAQKLFVPVRRWVDDLHHTADIAEEVARIYWFDAIWSAVYNTPLQAVPFTSEVETLRTIEHTLTWILWYTQVETYPWLHTRWHDEFPPSATTCYCMENSMAPELSYLRDTMVPSMLEVVEKNAPFYPTLHIYDIWTIRTKQGDKKERTYVTMASLAEKTTAWKTDAFLSMKQDCETILASYTDLHRCVWTHSTYSWAHTNQQADMYIGNTLVGTIAHLHPRIVDSIWIDVNRTVVVAYIDIMLLAELHAQQQNSLTYTTLQDQLIRKDISFVLPREGNYGQISDALLAVEEIDEVKLLDLYAGGSLAEDEKSISLSFLIKWDGSVTTEQISAIMQKAIDAGQRAGGKLRW